MLFSFHWCYSRRVSAIVHATNLRGLADLHLIVVRAHQGHAHEAHVVHRRVPDLVKRIDSGTMYLPNIIALATNSCDSSGILNDITGCTVLSTEEEIAACSCSASVLLAVCKCRPVFCPQPLMLISPGFADNCATCIVNDPTSTSGTQALLQYNGW